MLDVEMTPASISFGDVSIGQTAVQKVELRITDLAKKITGISAEDPRFAIKQIPGTEPGRSSVEVTFLGSKTQERIATGIRFSLEGGDASEANLPVRLQVVGNLRYPKQIFLMKKDDTFNTRDIDIVSRLEKPFKIIGATDTEGLLKLEFAKTAAKEAKITASVRNPKTTTTDKTIRGIIRIQTTDPVDSAIEIAYTISARRNAADIREQVERAKQKGTALPLLKAAKAEEQGKSAPVQ